MFKDNPWNAWQPGGGGGWSSASATAPEREPLDALHEYATRLNFVIARSREDALETALTQMDAIPMPQRDDLDTTMILERKRRELLEHLNVLRHEISYVPDVSLEAWLEYFFISADLSGAHVVTVSWDEPPPGYPPTFEVPLAMAPEFRRHVSELGLGLSQLRELNHVAPDGRGMAALDGRTSCLTLSGPPFFFEQTRRELDRVLHQAPIGCTFGYDRSKDVQEGMLLPVRLHLRNFSQDYLVFDALWTNHPYDQQEVFSRPSLGRLEFNEGLDCYTYQTGASGITEAPFRTAVLAPGDERMIAINLKMLESGDTWREFFLRFQRFGPEAFRQAAFVAVPGPTTHFPPDVIYARLSEVVNPERVDLSSVILHPGAAGVTQQAHWAYPFHVGRRAFSLAQARKRVGDDSEAVHFSRWQQAWVLRTASGCALVTQSRTTAYPRIQAECFVLVDESDQKVPIRFAEELVPIFMALPLGITDWESHRLGLPVSLPKLRLTALFHEVERLQCAMGLTRDLLSRSALIVTPDRN